MLQIFSRIVAEAARPICSTADNYQETTHLINSEMDTLTALKMAAYAVVRQYVAN